MARPKQQRIDPRRVEQAARGGGRAGTAPRSGTSPKNRGRSGRPGGRPIAEARPARLGDWIRGARPQTLALAIAPVAVGTGAASLLTASPWDHWVRALLCLAVAGPLQIGVNFANDYSDGVRGTDANRQGPQRLVGSGRAKPRSVLIVALVFFGIAAVAGGLIAWRTGYWWLLAVGAACIAAAWFYTGGKRPYGYAALGELAVFVFFGLVATAGTMFVQVGEVNAEAWIGGAAIGSLACAVLMVNNLRDREQDARSGKRTLAVLLGDRASRAAFVILLLLPFGALIFFVLFYEFAPYVFFALLAALPAALIVSTARSAPEYVTALKLTLMTAVLYGVALAAALAF